MRPIIFLFIGLLSTAVADAREARGIPKSAPAFTKFVAKFIQEALPSAKVTVAGRLRLDVEAPNGGHTTDLHNLYSTCQRAPDTCDEEVTAFVANAVYSYKEKDTGPSRGQLRIVVRPSAYVAAMRVNPKRDRPIAVPFVGDYWLIAVADHPTSIVMLDENDLAGLNLSRKDALMLAVANTRDALQKSVQKELSTDCRGILGGDPYTASAALFIDYWLEAAQRCHGNMFISIPAADVVLYTDGSKPDEMKSFTAYADHVVSRAEKPFTSAVFRLTEKGWAPVPPPAK
jgi:uncharacterized protein YtpQ (UPF0354 family)